MRGKLTGEPRGLWLHLASTAASACGQNPPGPVGLPVTSLIPGPGSKCRDMIPYSQLLVSHRPQAGSESSALAYPCPSQPPLCSQYPLS